MSAETAQSLVLGVYFVGAIVVGPWFWIDSGRELAKSDPSAGLLETGFAAFAAMFVTVIFATCWPLFIVIGILSLPVMLLGWVIKKI